jgi:hypothetical protein
MKLVSKLKLEIPLACQGCVAPARGILLGLGLLFPTVACVDRTGALRSHANRRPVAGRLYGFGVAAVGRLYCMLLLRLMGHLSQQEQKFAERYLLHCDCFY